MGPPLRVLWLHRCRPGLGPLCSRPPSAGGCVQPLRPQRPAGTGRRPPPPPGRASLWQPASSTPAGEPRSRRKLQLHKTASARRRPLSRCVLWVTDELQAPPPPGRGGPGCCEHQGAAHQLPRSPNHGQQEPSWTRLRQVRGRVWARGPAAAGWPWAPRCSDRRGHLPCPGGPRDPTPAQPPQEAQPWGDPPRWPGSRTVPARALLPSRDPGGGRLEACALPPAQL